MKKTKKTNKNNNLPATKKKVGRPLKYNPDYHPEMAFKLLADKGFTDLQLAKAFKVNESTIYDWKDKFPEFSKALTEGKEIFDVGIMEETSLKRAMGYEYIERTTVEGPKGVTVTTHEKHMPADPKSLWKWLQNRNPGRWGDLWKRNLDNDRPEGPSIHINILGELSIEQLERIRGIVRREVPAIVKDTNT